MTSGHGISATLSARSQLQARDLAAKTTSRAVENYGATEVASGLEAEEPCSHRGLEALRDGDTRAEQCCYLIVLRCVVPLKRDGGEALSAPQSRCME